MDPPKQHLALKPLEARLQQLTNDTDDYIAFTVFIQDMPCNQVIDMGIMPPRSTRGVVIDDALVGTAVMRSVVADKNLRDYDVEIDTFYQKTGVQELDIVFAQQPQAPSSSVLVSAIATFARSGRQSETSSSTVSFLYVWSISILLYCRKLLYFIAAKPFLN